MKFPWHKKQWQRLVAAKKTNQLPHALLLHGLPGLGKAQFAHDFARALLCQQSVNDMVACDQCHACRLVQGGVHPNLIYIKPESSGHAIKVDQIREASDFVYHSALQGAYRIIIIDPADNMNINAANALLKTLEEPPAHVVMILLSQQRHRLPATILSRCQQVGFAPPPQQEALHWLQAVMQKEALTKVSLTPRAALHFADGAPLKALALLQEDTHGERESLLQAVYDVIMQTADPIKSAADYQAMDSIVFIDLMLRFIQDCMRLQLTGDVYQGEDEATIAKLRAIATKISKACQLMLLDQLQAMRRQISQGMNLNKQLVVESIMLTLAG